ncbi:DNA-directed RNA polymerase II core subunit [Friedmanniomyces endolithicus]|uniref:DNA-directed RNA polymerase II core subunit n=1 Tax=Friedmanniomyces endolithicus TaxID=329885 RepID=A0AAN6GZF3_9PEZI|nr:DNA-directed RNA polymerase II core subunit [Friedmanniomyces endolithicus]KAK0779492.1 DNA-directed RNA polymerase II core subunit [Friedmanniomyces endolithicus]KAK0783069.1 DNA-directed RNA polymerase II core subunit [Friedmanniomyces endolithicus]KAK0785095.1 DNA-directed RNA polymerase II core subunit [Friedmanniomyces endolithicus]KAK0836412.1 DNA-directed RNA polymerase II core subunit [Friedmanniomyces endolithicus]
MAGDQAEPTVPKKLSGRLPAHSYHHSCGYSGVLDPRIGGNVGSKLMVDTAPDRYELFLLGEGEKKVTLEVETRVPNAALFTFNKEDHTLGNLLRDKLTRSPHVLFAAYQVPHPLFAVFKLRVQTNGEVTPKQAVVQACNDLVKELQTLDQEFTKEWELKKISQESGGEQF